MPLAPCLHVPVVITRSRTPGTRSQVVSCLVDLYTDIYIPWMYCVCSALSTPNHDLSARSGFDWDESMWSVLFRKSPSETSCNCSQARVCLPQTATAPRALTTSLHNPKSSEPFTREQVCKLQCALPSRIPKESKARSLSFLRWMVGVHSPGQAGESVLRLSLALEVYQPPSMGDSDFRIVEKGLQALPRLDRPMQDN